MKHLPVIVAMPIPHSAQRYDTAGDYFEAGNEPGLIHWDVTISKMDKWQYEALILIHELVEMVLTKNDGVDWKDIDEFDRDGEGKDHPDPGTLESSPYYIQHKRATYIEKAVAHWMGIDWEDYEKAFEKLEYK